MKEIKIWLGVYCRRIFLVEGWTIFWLMGGDSNFQLVGRWGSLPVRKTLIFRLTPYLNNLLNYLTTVLTSTEILHIMLLSYWDLIPQLCLHFFQKLKYYTLENKDYFRKLFWVVAAINVNAGEVTGTVSPLVKIRNKLSWVLWLSLQKPYQLQGFYLCLHMVDSWLLKLQLF